MYKLFIGCAFVILRSLSYHQGIERCGDVLKCHRTIKDLLRTVLYFRRNL